MDEFLEKSDTPQDDPKAVSEPANEAEAAEPQPEVNEPLQTAASISLEKPSEEIKVREPAADAQEPAAQEKPAAEISLEGRKLQLEKKVSEQLAEDTAPANTGAAQAAPVGAAAVHAPASYAAPAAAKPKMSNAARAYLIVIVGVLTVFIIGFALECARAYRANGIFGGDLDRFLDSDNLYSFGNSDSDDKGTDSEKKPFGGFFSFDQDSDSDTAQSDSDSSEKPATDSESKVILDSDVKPAPDTDSIIDPMSANLVPNDQPDDIDSTEYTVRKVYKDVSGSVVSVVTYYDCDHVGNKEYKTGSGSGIILTENGYIMTNSHVINDSASTGVEIVTTDGKRYAAACVGFDTRTDLAVVKIDADGLTPVTFVDSNQLEVGQDAIAIGSPGGLAYSNSLTKGVVSALNRTVPTNKLVSYIQTDAAINPGNSGGPLLNSAGQVMGIATIKIANTDYEGMGFAIPSNTAIAVANSLIMNGFVRGRVRIGIIGTVYTSGMAEGITGIKIESIEGDSPLNDTEVKPGDVITSLDGISTPNFTVLYSVLGEHTAGDKVTLSIYRPPTPGNAEKRFEVEIKVISDEGDTDK